MSLVQHLRGDLGRALAALCPNVRDAAAGVEAAADLAAADGPVVKPARRMPMDYYAAVGSIVGQRLADAIEPAPPYPALLGAIRCGALGASEAGLFALGYPTHQVWPMDAKESRSGVFLRPTPDGWLIVDGPLPDDQVDDDPGIRRVLAEHRDAAARGTVGELDSLDIERERLPALHLLQQLEDVYRGADDLRALQRVADTGHVRISRQIADDAIQVLDHNREALHFISKESTGDRGRLGHAAPLFVPHWAEGDVLVGPHPLTGGGMLLDIKTVTRPDAARAAEWVLQVIAYALLDVRNRWKIDRVGLWLTRHATFAAWTLDELVGDVEAVRSRWLPQARRCARSDGADVGLLFEGAA